MQVESFGDGLLWLGIALIQVIAIVWVIRTGDPIDHLAESDVEGQRPQETADVRPADVSSA
jgi:hypothetical protein